MSKKPKLNPAEVSKLVKLIKEGATSSTTPLGEILRMCMRLGQELKDEELLQWARSEASGYSENDELPDYRFKHTQVFGDFLGPFGSGLRNASIPESSIDNDHRKVLCNLEILQPVMELEDLATNTNTKGNVLTIKWSGDAIAIYQDRELYSNGLQLASAWQVISQQVLVGILETIRTRVLDFILQIEQTLGDELLKETEETILKSSDQEKISQVFHNTIYTNDGNVAIGNTGSVKQTIINVKQGNLESLKEYLSELGINKQQISELEDAIERDGEPQEEIGSEVSNWIMSITVFALKGGLSVASNLVASLLASAILRYYGMQ